MTNLQKNETIQKIRTAVREILIRLKLRKPKDISIELCANRERFDYESLTSDYTKKKRLPNTGSNFSKIPILAEIPKIPNPAAWVSSKTQNDTKPIKN